MCYECTSRMGNLFPKRVRRKVSITDFKKLLGRMFKKVNKKEKMTVVKSIWIYFKEY